MSIDTLTGGAHGKGEVDLYLAKLKLKEHMLGPFLEKHGFESSAKVTLRKVFASFESYRLMLKPVDKDKKASDLSWCAGWKDSSVRLLGFIEDRGTRETTIIMDISRTGISLVKSRWPAHQI
jgi:hypothetical protein